MIDLIASYNDSNCHSEFWLDNVNEGQYQAQEFLNESRCYLEYCKFSLYNDVPAITGQYLYAYLYARTGPVGYGKPTGSPLAVSDPVEVSSILKSRNLVTFTFSGDQKILLEENTAYCIVIKGIVNDGVVALYVDTDSPTTYGIFSVSQNGTLWDSLEHDVAMGFYIYGTPYFDSGRGVWGYLPKNQVSNETIEQAITRLIAVHEADPNSHLGEGESMQNHKNADVIDHPALSIVPDKFSNAQTFLEIGNYPVDSGEVDNCVVNANNRWLGLNQISPLTGDGTYVFASIVPFDMGYSNGDFIIDFIFYGIGSSGTWLITFDMTFAKVEIKQGYYRVGYYTTGWNFTSWVAITNGIPQRFRFAYSATYNEIYVYLRDVLVYTFNITPYYIDDTDLLFSFIINRGSASSVYATFGSFKYWFDGI